MKKELSTELSTGTNGLTLGLSKTDVSLAQEILAKAEETGGIHMELRSDELAIFYRAVVGMAKEHISRPRIPKSCIASPKERSTAPDVREFGYL